MNLTTSNTELQRKQNDHNNSVISRQCRQHADEISKQTKETEKYRSLQLKLKRRLLHQKNAFSRRCHHYNDQLATQTQELEHVYATKLEYQREKWKRRFSVQLAQKSDCINELNTKIQELKLENTQVNDANKSIQLQPNVQYIKLKDQVGVFLSASVVCSFLPFFSGYKIFF